MWTFGLLFSSSSLRSLLCGPLACCFVQALKVVLACCFIQAVKVVCGPLLVVFVQALKVLLSLSDVDLWLVV
jgi:hypothetical protein